MKYAYLIVHSDTTIETVEKDSIELDLKELQEAVHGGIEIVTPGITQMSAFADLRIVCDDCGLMREKPKLNLLASILYGAPTPIVGDVVFCSSLNPDPYAEPDIWAFEASRARDLKKYLHRVKSSLK